MLSVVIIIFVVLLINLTSKQPSEKIQAPTKTIITEQPAPSILRSNAQTSEQCSVEGGDWEEWGSEGQAFCQIPSQDAGKSCTDGSQCSYGVCRSTENTPAGEGVCSKYPTEFGCYNVIKNGQIEDRVCVD